MLSLTALLLAGHAAAFLPPHFKPHLPLQAVQKATCSHSTKLAPNSKLAAVALDVEMSALGDESQELVKVTGDNVDLTDALVAYAKQKIGKPIAKHRQYIISVGVHLQVKRNPSIKESDVVEVTVFAKDAVIRSTGRTESMYASLDMVSDQLARKLRKYKERKTDGFNSGSKMEDLMDEEDMDMEAEDDALEEDATSAVMKIVKRKSFAMPPMSVEDAAVCLDYIDHDFYIFRNKDTTEVNVVYKRNSGGIGLIEPEQD